MPQIKPFAGYRYSPRLIPDMAKVLAPPYDVISPVQREALYGKSPYNFVRVDFKKKEGVEDAYGAAKRELDGWIDKGVMAHEGSEALYIYVQTYKNLFGKKARRVGFISLMKLDPRKVKRHERTLSGPKIDRAKILGTLGANLSPIFGFFEDKNRKIHSLLSAAACGKPAVDVTIDGVRNELFVETDPSRIRAIQTLIGPKPMYIADGHHRFEVSLRHAEEERRTKSPHAEAASYVMTYLCAAEHNDLTIYPTHRALRVRDGMLKSFERVIDRSFKARKKTSLNAVLKELAKTKKVLLGVALSGRRPVYLVLEPKAARGELNVVLADRELVRPLLQGEEVAQSSRVRYSRDPGDVRKWLASGEAQVGIFLSPLAVSEVIRVSDKGVFLPQKSTYFYPKLLSGLVFYKFE